MRTLSSAVDTVECYYRLQRYDEALELSKESVLGAKKVLGDKHPTTLRSIFGLAATHIKMDQVDVGLAMLQELFLLQQRNPVDDHPNTQAIRNALEIFNLHASELRIE